MYQRIADNILSQGNLGGEPYKTYGDPSISPGWAFFLAGYEFFFGKSVAALVAASVTLGSLLAVGVYLIAALFFGGRTAFIAGMISSVWPVFLIQTFKYGNSLLLYSVLLLFGSYFLAKAIRGGRWYYAAAAGALLGCAALVDAIGFFIPFILVAWLLIERCTWRTVRLAVVFLVAAALVIAPWTYRNIAVSHTVTQEAVPIIAKDELKRLTSAELSHMATLAGKRDVLLSGFSKLYIFPFDISILDQQVTMNESQRQSGAFSYKVKVFKLIQGEPVAFSGKEALVLATKVAITLLHWVLLILTGVAITLCVRARQWSYPLLTLLLFGYVTAAVIGFGSLAQDDFQSISAPNSFLFPLVPLIIVLASASLTRLYERIRRCCFATAPRMLE